MNLEALREFGKAKDALNLITIIAEMEPDKRDICSSYLKEIQDNAGAALQRILRSTKHQRRNTRAC